MSTQSQLRPVGGLAYMVTAPTDMESALADPIHAIIYMAFMILSCGGLSYMWISVSGSSVKEEVQKLQAEGYHLSGSRATKVGQTDQHAINTLQKYIPTAALLGGMAIGACAFVRAPSYARVLQSPSYSRFAILTNIFTFCNTHMHTHILHLPGVLTIVADFMGAIGSGTGLLLAVTTIYEYYETVRSETGNDLTKVFQK